MSNNEQLSTCSEHTTIHVSNDESYSTSAAPVAPSTTEKKPADGKDSVVEDKYAKWVNDRLRITVLVSIAAFLGPIATVMYLPSLKTIENDLHTTEALVALTLSCYTVSLAFFPLIWGPLSDIYSRKKVLQTGMLLYIIAALGCSVPFWGIHALIFFRILQAMGSASLVVVGAGSISDVYPPHLRSKAMGWFGVSPLIGPLIGPTIGGQIAEWVGWRGTFWLLAALAIINSAIIACYLPETLDPSKVQEKKSVNPLVPLSYWFTPIIGSLALGQALTFGCMYVLMVVFSFVAAKTHDLSEARVGLALTPFGLGTVCGTVFGGNLSGYTRSLWGPPALLIPSCAALMIAPLAVVGFGYSCETNLYLAIFCTFVIGLCLSTARPGTVSFAIENMPSSASGVVACIISAQFSCAAIGIAVSNWLLHYYDYETFFSGYALLLLIGSLPTYFTMILKIRSSKLSPPAK